LALAYGIFYPHTPLNSEVSHRVEVERPPGAVDERGYYWQASFLRYLRREGEVWPDQQWALAGAAWRRQPTRAVERGVIGYFGYWAGTDKIIIDTFGLADPLLARLPADPSRTYRVGHFARALPAGYREVVMTGNGRLIDPQLNAFYERLVLITQSDHLFAGERLRAIIALNLGRYDHYLAGRAGEVR
jgi:arabinofuranosyltransferase